MQVYEYTYTRKRIAELPEESITSPIVARNILVGYLDGVETERLVVVAVNTKNRIIGVETLYSGNLAGSAVRVGEVFRFPVRLCAASIIVAHNHPSTEVTPSADDIHITSEIAKAGQLLDIPLMDHIIMGESGNYLSLRASRPDVFAIR